MGYISQISSNGTIYDIKAKTLAPINDISSAGELPIFFGQQQSTGSYDIRYNSSVSVRPSTGVLMGAAWNDYAEYRAYEGQEPKPGRVVCETGKDTVSLSQERLQAAPSVVSDTFGFVIGDKKNTVPVSVAGKVLVYPNEDLNSYGVGDAFCSGPDGTVSKMSRQEIINYPDRILGYFVGIPEEDTFNGVAVNGRFWIKVV